jgi:periplasmic copper chaperone A
LEIQLKVHRIAALVLTLAASSAASAHITLETTSTVPGSYAKVALRVTHGCAGSSTTSVEVHVPEDFRFAKGQAKPGWTITYEQAKLTTPVQLHERTLSETTAVVRWSGSLLPNDQFDEFTLLGQLSKSASGSMPFRVLQSCEKGETDWSGPPNSKTPAPILKVMPAASPTKR